MARSHTPGRARGSSRTSIALSGCIGRGGMGAVYAGTHVDLDRVVALKLLLPDPVTDPLALERFRREARTAAKINHPNVAATYDYGALPDGEAYLAMELVEGQTLREYLHATVPLGVPEAAKDGDRLAHRHTALYVIRTVRWQRSRRALRHLRARHYPLRDARRPPFDAPSATAIAG